MLSVETVQTEVNKCAGVSTRDPFPSMKEFFDGVSLGLLPADRLHTGPLHALRGVGSEVLVVELEVGRGVEADVAVHGYVSIGVDERADVGLHDDGGGEGIPRAAEDAADLGGGVGEGGGRRRSQWTLLL